MSWTFDLSFFNIQRGFVEDLCSGNAIRKYQVIPASFLVPHLLVTGIALHGVDQMQNQYLSRRNNFVQRPYSLVLLLSSYWWYQLEIFSFVRHSLLYVYSNVNVVLFFFVEKLVFFCCIV